MSASIDPQALRIIFLAAVGWDTLQAGRTRHLAHALAEAGHPVSFVEFPSLRRPLGRKSRRGDDGVDVVRLPPYSAGGRPLPGWNTAWRACAIHKLNRRSKSPTAVVVTTPWWAPLLPRLKADLICYDCNDHFSIHAGRVPTSTFADWHRSVMSISGLVTTVSKCLQDELSREAGDKLVHLLPNGVDESWFHSPISAASRERMHCSPNRRIAGFVGSIFEWVDLELIRRCAAKLPGIDFVLVGPLRRGITLGDLLPQPNVRYCGPIPPAEVPGLIAAFDVCLLPFKRGRISDAADPIKIYEYCALGKPIVATHGCECQNGSPLWLTASNDAEFIAAIPRAIADDSSHAIRNRIQFAQDNTWQIRARRLLELLQSQRGGS